MLIDSTSPYVRCDESAVSKPHVSRSRSMPSSSAFPRVGARHVSPGLDLDISTANQQMKTEGRNLRSGQKQQEREKVSLSLTCGSSNVDSSTPPHTRSRAPHIVLPQSTLG